MSGVLRPPSSVAAPERKGTDISPKEFLSLAGRSLAVSYKARGLVSCIVSIVGFAFALAPSVIAWLMGAFTNSVQQVFEGTAPATNSFIMLVALMTMYVAQLGYTCLRSYFDQADSERMMRYIRKRTLTIICRVRLRHIDNEGGFAERVSFVDTQAGLQAAGSMQQIALWLQNVIAFAALAFVLAGVDPWMILIVVITALPSIILTYLQERERYKLSCSLAHTTAFAQMYYQDATRFQTLQEVRFNRIFPYIKKHLWRPAVDEVIEQDGAMKRRHALMNTGTDLLAGSVYIFVLALAAAKIYEDPALGLGVFTLTLASAEQMQALVSQLFTGVTKFVASAPYIKDFFSLEDFDCEPTELEVPTETTEDDTPADIVFKNVSFTYPGASQEALRNITVTIREGERIAIVGRNGSGKSTFVNLLCGFYTPDSGEVLVADKRPYEQPREVREDLSAIFQDFARYEDTIRQNIAISAPERPLDDRAMLALARITDAYETIESRTNGLDDIVGSYSEQGNNLSGGQWQRVAITRAAWRDKARIMLLAEPTSALDPMAEAEIYKHFSDLIEHRTALLISHRLGVTSQVERVLVFDDGRIVEDGSPEELLAADGLFAELYKSQAQWYQ